MSHPGPLVDHTSVLDWLGLLVRRTAELGPGDLRSWEPAAEYDLDVAWRLAEQTEVIR